jgi:hypothetical protein
MKRTPTALFISVAGVLLLSGLCFTSGFACKVGEEKSTVSGLTAGPGDVNAELLSACTDYCGYIYSAATGCDPDQMSAEELGCRGFCSIFAKSLPDQCEALYFDHYTCVVDEGLGYECSEASTSPQVVDDNCEAATEKAEACLASSTSR